MRIPCQLPNLFEKITQLIPSSLRPEQKKRPTDFTRRRKLPLERLIVSVLSLVGGGRTEGVETEMESLFKLARRSKLWPQAQAPCAGALTKARAKVSWNAFREIQEKAARLAYDIWPERPGDRWHGMNVLAIDGSKYDLPAAEKIRNKFDPDSGLGIPGKGHYPQCLVSTLYDVFRALPLARAIAPYRSCERQEALKLLDSAPDSSLIVLDRGYPSYEMFLELDRRFSGHYLFRSPATSTFLAVGDFLKTTEREALILIPPSYKSKRSARAEGRPTPPPICLRVIRAPDLSEEGKEIVFLTSLLDMEIFPREEIIDLYFKRWAVEVGYREEKVTQDIEHFHSRSVNGVLQELYAVMIVTVISRMMAAVSESIHNLSPGVARRKHAVVSLAREAALLAPTEPRKALTLFEELLGEMARRRYHMPKKPKPPPPRISKAAANKWATRARLSASP